MNPPGNKPCMKATLIAVLVLVSSTAFGFSRHHHGHHHSSSHHSSSSSRDGSEGVCLRWADVSVEASDAGSPVVESPVGNTQLNDGGPFERQHFEDVDGDDLEVAPDEMLPPEDDADQTAVIDAGHSVVAAAKARICLERAPSVGCGAAPGGSLVALFALAALVAASNRKRSAPARS